MNKLAASDVFNKSTSILWNHMDPGSHPATGRPWSNSKSCSLTGQIFVGTFFFGSTPHPG